MGFYASTRIEFAKTGKVETSGQRAEKGELKAKKIQVGDWIQAKAVKEKTSKPYQQGSYIFRTDEGRIDQLSEIIQLGLEDEIIRRVGKRYEYETLDGMEFSGQEAKFREMLEEDDEVRQELIDAIEDMTYQISRVSADG